VNFRDFCGLENVTLLLIIIVLLNVEQTNLIFVKNVY